MKDNFKPRLKLNDKSKYLITCVAAFIAGGLFVSTLLLNINSPTFAGARYNPASTQLETVLHYATSSVVPQQSKEEIRLTYDVLRSRSPCNFLVFGLGHDSQMWHAFNPGGTTLFLEDNPKWMENVLKDAPFLGSETCLRQDKKMVEVNYLPGPDDGYLLSRQSEHRSELIWRGEDLDHLRLRLNFASYWTSVRVSTPDPSILTVIRDSGLDGVYQIGAIRHDSGMITAFVERWRPETHSFHTRFGEVTITLEDVHHILGLPTGGRPVIHHFGSPSLQQRRDMVGNLLGVYPGPTDVTKGGIKISWLLEHFGTCERLCIDYEDYDNQLLFHTRAHLLLILGSLFSNSSGNKIQIQLLPFVENISEVGTYSWGSAVLAYLYRQLCSSSIGRKTEICGSMTLLQIWIWERFTSLAPVRTQDLHIEHPLALRWTCRMSRKDVPNHSTRIVRYELDQMGDDDHFLWRPYRDMGADSLPSVYERSLWSARCPLIFNEIVEWCYTDRVARQFGRRQDIPSLPEENHTRLHSTLNDGCDWPDVYAHFIELWLHRENLVLAPDRFPPIRKRSCSTDYFPWFLSVTRRFIGNPSTSSSGHCFQGSQGHPQFYLEGMSHAYHAIQSSAHDIPEASDILRDRMTATGHSYYEHIQPSQPPVPASGSQTETSTHTTTARSRGPPSVQPVLSTPDDHDAGWDDWAEALLQDQTQYTGGDRWDAGGSSGFLGQDQTQYTGGGRLDISGSHGGSHVHTPPAQSQHDDIGHSPFQTPHRGFGEFATQGNPWSTPTSTSIEDESVPHVQQRQQPTRRVKGRGRRCFTGSHIL